MHFWDFALKQNLPNQNKSVLLFKCVVCQNRFVATFLHFHAHHDSPSIHDWCWPLTFALSLRRSKSFIGFITYVFEWRVQKSALGRSHRGAAMWQMKTYRSSAIHKYFTFHWVPVMKVLIVSWQFECAANGVVFHFHFITAKQTLLLFIIFMLLRKKKSKVVLFPWFVEHKEIVSLKSYVFWEFN